MNSSFKRHECLTTHVSTSCKAHGHSLGLCYVNRKAAALLVDRALRPSCSLCPPTRQNESTITGTVGYQWAGSTARLLSRFRRRISSRSNGAVRGNASGLPLEQSESYDLIDFHFAVEFPTTHEIPDLEITLVGMVEIDL